MSEYLRERLESIRDMSCEEYQSPDAAPSFEVIRQIYCEAIAAIEIMNESPLIYEYAGGDATEKTYWRSILEGVESTPTEEAEVATIIT